VIRVVTQNFEGHSKSPHAGRVAGAAGPGAVLARPSRFCGEHQHIREVVPWFKSSYQLRMNDKKQTEIPVSRAQTKRLRELFNL